MNTLSPAAQVVLDAYEQSSDAYFEERGQLAAALRTVVDKLSYELLGVRVVDCSQILILAKELEGSDT